MSDRSIDQVLEEYDFSYPDMMILKKYLEDNDIKHVRCSRPIWFDSSSVAYAVDYIKYFGSCRSLEDAMCLAKSILFVDMYYWLTENKSTEICEVCYEVCYEACYDNQDPIEKKINSYLCCGYFLDYYMSALSGFSIEVHLGRRKRFKRALEKTALGYLRKAMKRLRG